MSAKHVRIEKGQLLIDLAAIRQRILDRSLQFDRQMTAQAFVGHWTIIELLAHLAGWDEANQEAVQAIMAGRLPGFYKHAGKDWNEFNRILVARYSVQDLSQMLSVVANSHQKLMAQLENLPDEAFTTDFGLRYKGYKVILGRLLRSEAEDEKVHLEQIETFLATQQARA
jgi:hypothetical protein